MSSIQGTVALGLVNDSTAAANNDSYCPPWEIEAIQHHALGRMMAGLAMCMLGLILGLVSPTVAAQSDYAAPDAIHLGVIGVIAMALVLVLLAWLRKNGQRAPNRQPDGRNMSVGQRQPGADSSTFTLLDETAILRRVGEHFDRCRNQQDYLGVLRIGLDQNAKPESSYAATALRETIASLSKSRGAILLPAANEEFVVVLPGDLPDQALQICDDFREAVADLALVGSNGLMTTSVGLFVARPEVECRAEYFLERSAAALERARGRGGNRVESETV